MEIHVREITGKGADFALERPPGGRAPGDRLPRHLRTCGIVGATKECTDVAFNVIDVMIPGRQITDIMQGDVVANSFIRVLIDLYRHGSRPIYRFVRCHRFEEINRAVEDSEKRTIKPILRTAPETAAEMEQTLWRLEPDRPFYAKTQVWFPPLRSR